MLDVGCNIGITSEYLLETGAANQVTGIELSAETVSASLREDPRFRLIEGDVARLELNDRFDVCIYGAVHHHVVNHHGLGTAVSVLQKLTASCDNTLFLETGQLSEGARWHWQRALRRYFRTDEEHLFYLLACIEHSIDDFHVVGRYWIHGIRRWYIKIDLKPPDFRRLPLPPAKRISIRNEPTMILGRTFGSRDQRLVPSTEAEVRDSPSLFWVAESVDGEKLFLKRHVHSPTAGVKELAIGAQIPHRWAINCMGLFDDAPTLVFPFVQIFKNVRMMHDDSRQSRRNVAAMLLTLFNEARNTSVYIERQLLLPAVGKLAILQVCDFNANNLLIVKEEGSVSIRIVDFEQQSCRYGWRNRLHLSHMLLQLRQYRHRALLEFILGTAGMVTLLVHYQFLPIKRRIQDRQPALLSVLVTECRSQTGRILRRALNLFGYE